MHAGRKRERKMDPKATCEKKVQQEERAGTKQADAKRANNSQKKTKNRHHKVKEEKGRQGRTNDVCHRKVLNYSPRKGECANARRGPSKMTQNITNKHDQEKPKVGHAQRKATKRPSESFRLEENAKKSKWGGQMKLLKQRKVRKTKKRKRHASKKGKQPGLGVLKHWRRGFT